MKRLSVSRIGKYVRCRVIARPATVAFMLTLGVKFSSQNPIALVRA